MKRAAIALAAVILSSASPSGAKVVEEELRVPVTVVTALGKAVARDIVVSVFQEDDTAPQPYPLLVLHHGRSWDPAARASLGRARYLVASRWFAGLGFMVAVPTRVGYGVTGGEDVEDSGPCNRKTYEPAFAASTTQTRAVIDVLRARAAVAKDRTVIVGQSFGGTTAIAIAAQNPPGIQAAINFAGGGGGNPTTRPQQPCGQRLLERLFANYGKTARIPTLWVYTENDMYFGPRLPRQWFSAYQAAGGVGEFTLFPPFGDDGHTLFTRAPQAWQPKVLQFLRANGYPGL